MAGLNHLICLKQPWNQIKHYVVKDLIAFQSHRLLKLWSVPCQKALAILDKLQAFFNLFRAKLVTKFGNVFRQWIKKILYFPLANIEQYRFQQFLYLVLACLRICAYCVIAFKIHDIGSFRELFVIFGKWDFSMLFEEFVVEDSPFL